MEDLSRSSFIPKQVVGTAPKRSGAPRRFRVLNVIAVVLLIAALLLSLGAYFYQRYAESQLSKASDDLATSADSIDLKTLDEVKGVDYRLRAAQYLLDQHLSPSRIFDALERATNVTVQFNTFSYSRRPSGGVDVSLGGVTNEFKSVALQRANFSKDPVLGSALLTALSFGANAQSSQSSQSTQLQQQNIATAASGAAPTPQVSFSLAANVAQSAIGYQAPSPADQQSATGTIPSFNSTASTTSSTTGSGT